MKKLYLAGKVILGLALVLSFAGCASNGLKVTMYKDDSAPHFADEDSVNAVLNFSSWEYTFLTRPQYTEGGYLQQINRQNIAGVLDRMHVRRGTAAVVIGWTYNGDQLKEVVTDWKKILGDCGFQRVVVLRAQLGKKLNGSVVVDDSILHLGSVQTPSRGS